ncbi:alpha/beta hydrolase [Thiohalophilus sp.]|uniref:alpha/beta hydrolase n=1 Tax=Thiohalophilus sp. TaxID=3028392 RepID=UPI002ACE7231|nr:alpha/beta fold hydrolase [Thiohalophilus sp.]MDZ7661952.1 alpha/beta fold hydrolase [Thiohalophilus sp.]
MKVEKPDNPAQQAPVAVLCHPHPLHGGSLTNKVVHILAATMNKLGATAVRFNFRGVSRSEGEFDNMVGELDDLRAVVEWVREQYPDAPLWLGGFSFGAQVALKMHARVGAERLLVAAPPLSLYGTDDLPEIAIPWLVIQGSEDEVIDAHQVRDWVARQTANPPQLIWLDGAGHFFHGRLNEVREAVIEEWSRM